MSYRALFVADVHLSNSLPFGVRHPADLVTDRFRDVLAVVKQMCEYGCDKDIKDVWILGDLLDRRLLDAVTLKLAVTALAAPAPFDSLVGHHNVRILPGNHEAADAECRHYTVEMFEHMGIELLVREEPLGLPGAHIEPVPGFKVFAMPYIPHAQAEEVLDGIAKEQVDLLLLHQTIKGGCIGGWVSPDGLDPLKLTATQTLAGHFHVPQDILPNVSYIGAPLQHSFADSGDNRGFWDITFNEDGSTERTMIPITNAPRFHVLQWKAGEEPPDVSAISQHDYVNLKVSGSKAQVDKIWRDVLAWGDQFGRELGTRLVKSTPETDVAPAKQRIVLGDSDRPSWEQIVSSYLNAQDCTGLNRDRLASMAKEFIQDGES